VTLADVGLFSDGTAVKLVGEETFRVARGLVDEFMTVDTDAVCAAIKDVFVDTRSIVEPAGALAVAAIKQYVATHKTKGETYAAILCGANMNFDRLRFVAERAEWAKSARPVRRHHPRGARQLPALLRSDRHPARRPAQRDRVQLPHQRRRAQGPCVRGPDHAAARAKPTTIAANFSATASRRWT
jgi:hypothetical protein